MFDQFDFKNFFFHENELGFIYLIFDAPLELLAL
jgi:hypothetical protein